MRVRPSVSAAVTVFRSSLLAALAAAVLSPATLVAQSRAAGASITPFAGFVYTGNWYDGPYGTSLKNTNGPVFGVSASLPMMPGLSLAGSLAYQSGDLKIGLPVLSGINVGSTKTWMYDVALELGGLGTRSEGFAPFVSAGIGGMSNDVKASVLNVTSTNVAFTVGAGLDISLSPGMALRFQARDWIGRFDTQEAVGFTAMGNLANNIALTGGVKFTF